MQAAGLVNDHTVDCFRYRELSGETADSKGEGQGRRPAGNAPTGTGGAKSRS